MAINSTPVSGQKITEVTSTGKDASQRMQSPRQITYGSQQAQTVTTPVQMASMQTASKQPTNENRQNPTFVNSSMYNPDFSPVQVNYFNGKTYKTKEEMQAAKQQFAALAYADYLSVGGDEQAFKTLTGNKQGLSQLSEHELNYISKLQKTDTSPTAYTKSAYDQYLQSIGMPSAKDLTQYRAKYAKYIGDGGILDVYKDLSSEEFEYIKQAFDKDSVVGLNGDRIARSKEKTSGSKNNLIPTEDPEYTYKELKYEDTYLDEQLKANGLPPAKEMERYHSQYIAEKEAKQAKQAEREQMQSRVNNLYDAALSYVERQGIKDTDANFDIALYDALTEMLKLDAYKDLSDYRHELERVPTRQDDAYLNNLKQFDETKTNKFNDDVAKAQQNNAKRDQMEYVVSSDGLANYYVTKQRNIRNDALSKKYAEIYEKNIDIVNTPAKTEAEKEKQANALSEYLRVYGGGATPSDYAWYTGAINAGVPLDVCQRGVDAVTAWSAKNFQNDPKKMAEVQYAVLGGDDYFGGKNGVESALAKTNETVKQSNYEKQSTYNPSLYYGQMDKNSDFAVGTAVTTQGAIYALVNGKLPARLSDFGSSDYDSLYTNIRNAIGETSFLSQLTDEERGTFNYLYAKNPDDPKEAMEYLQNLYLLLGERASNTSKSTLARSVVEGMSDRDMSDYAYDAQAYNFGKQLLAISDDDPDAWMKEAWQKYSNYSDEQLEYMKQQAVYLMNTKQSDPDATYTEEEMRLLRGGMGKEIDFVLDKRKELRYTSDMVGYLRDFDPEEGKADTKSVNDMLYSNNGKYVDGNGNSSEYAGVVNGIGQDTYQIHPDIDQSFTAKELSVRDYAKSMTQEEIDAFNWLLVNKGAGAADEYFEGIMNELDMRAANAVTQERKQWAKEHPFWATTFSNIAFPMTGLAAVAGTVENLITGTELTRTQAAQWDITNEWREGVSEDMGGVGAFAYQTFMSMMDSGAAAGMNMALPGLGEITLAATAYSGALRSSLDRGLDPLSATATATFAGLAEYVTEKIGLETLVEGVKSLGKGATRSLTKQAIINTAKQAVYEGSEELASDFINLFADNLINVDQSEFNQNVDNYVRQGFDRKEAERLAWKDWTSEAAVSFLGGFISGGLMAGGGNIGGVAIRGLESYGLGDQRAAVGNQRHVDAYSQGRGIVNEIFGNAISYDLQQYLGTKETVGLSKHIDAVDNYFTTNPDKSSYWYRYVYDQNGNIKLNDDQRVAFASALSVFGANADSESIDEVLASTIASQQTKSQREAYRNSKFVMSTFSYNEAIHNIEQAKSQLENLPKRVDEINTKIKDVEARLEGVRKKIYNLSNYHESTYSTGTKFISDTRDALETLRNRQSTLLTELANHRNELETLNVKGTIENNQNIIKTNQDLLDKHWASLAYLIEYTGNTASIYNEQFLANSKQRYDRLGELVDSNLDGTDEAQLATLREQQTQAKEDIERAEKALSENSSGAHEAMLAAKAGDVQKFLKDRAAVYAQGMRSQIQATQAQGNADAQARASDNAQTQATETTRDERTAEDELPPLPDEAVEQNENQPAQETAPAEPETAPTSEASNSTAEMANEENTASESATEASQPVEKVVYNISKKIQQKFDTIASRFGCEIVWKTRDEINGNGMYDPSTPNKIYLATDLLANKGMSGEMAVAREFFVHEIVHYVANTKAYRTLANYAYDYYRETLGEDGVRAGLAGIIEEEASYGNTVDTAYAEEEMTAQFAQDVLFQDEKALNWLARKDTNALSDMLMYVEFLIKRGKIRKMKNGSTIKTLLVDSEFALAKAIEERQYLDKANKTSAYLTSDQIMKQAKERADQFEQELERGQTPEPEQAPEQQVQESPDEAMERESAPEQAQPEQPVTEPASVELTSVQTKQASTIASRLSNGNSVVLKIPTDENFHAVADAMHEAVLASMPEDKRGSVTYTATLNGETIQEKLAQPDTTNLIITASGVKADVAGKASQFNLLVPNQQKHSRGNSFADYGERDARNDIRRMAEGKNISHSRDGRSFEEYAPIDWSKNKIKQADGTDYDVLYSGSISSGHTVFDRAYADDGLSVVWLTNEPLVAQSYAREKSEDPLAREFNPYFSRDTRQMDGTKVEYFDTAEQYDTPEEKNDALYKYLDENPCYGELDMFAKEVGQFNQVSNEALAEWGESAYVFTYAMDDAMRLYEMIRRLATNHDDATEELFIETFEEMSEAIDELSDAAYEDIVLQRSQYNYDDYYNNKIHLDGDSLSYHVSELARFRTVVEDSILDSGLFETLREADEGGSDTKLALDSNYKGVATLYSDSEARWRLPKYTPNNGIYKLRAYAENPLIVDVNGSWSMIDYMLVPDEVQQRLAELYGWNLGYSTRNVARAAYETGYDGVIYRNIYDSGRAKVKHMTADVITLFDSNQAKSIYNSNPTTRSDIRYSRGRSMQDYAKVYGKHEQNAFARKRNIVTAKRTSPNNRVSKSVQTLKQVPSLQQYRRAAIDNQVLWEGMGVYDPVTLENMREWGRDYIARSGGLKQAMLDLTRDLRSANFRNITQLISAANQVFYELGAEQPGLINSNDYNKFVAEYIATRSEWGRVGKAMQLVNDSPVGRRMYWERVVEKMNENNREAVSQGVDRLFHKNYKDIVVPQHMFDMLEQAKTEEEMNKAEYAITQYIGEHSPLTVAEALRNWRYFAMLFNPVTHIRNLLGNVTMRGGVTVKDAIAAGMENAAVRMNLMDASERTHAIVLQQDNATKDYIEKLYQQNKEMIQSGGRDGFYQQMMNAKKRSPIKAVDFLMRLNTDYQTKNPKLQKLADMISLEGEDAIFLRASFKKAAAQYIQARGIDVNNITKEQRHDIVQYATQQAQEATYRDASKLADALNQFAKSGWVQRLAVEAVMPFKKTPINIAKRGFSYSPFGLARGLVDLARDAVAKSKGGELVVPASKVVDELAQGLTGTALAMLGFFLAQAGVLRLSAGAGDKDDKFAQDTGHQGYSLEIGDLSIKIESLAPMTFPLFMGAALEKWKTQGGDSFTVSDFTDALLSISDPLMDMSFMSSLNSVLQTYDENQLKGVAVNALQSYTSQYLPTLGAKLNNSVIDPLTRRTTKSSAASPVGSTWDYWLRSSLSKIPGGTYALEPYVKTTGEVDKTDSFGEWALNFFNNFVSPVNVKIMDTSNVNTEVLRLVQKTGNTDFVPQNPKKYLTVDNERYNMTASQYTQYSREYNEATYAAITAVMSMPAYQNLTDDEKVKVLDSAYDSAKRAVQDKYKIIVQTGAWE